MLSVTVRAKVVEAPILTVVGFFTSGLTRRFAGSQCQPNGPEPPVALAWRVMIAPLFTEVSFPAWATGAFSSVSWKGYCWKAALLPQRSLILPTILRL